MCYRVTNLVLTLGLIRVDNRTMGQKPGKSDGSSPLQGRQETFCQLYSQGTHSASEAYRRAGYSHKSADAHSARLAVKGSIKARIAWIRAELAEKEQITRETLAADYNRALRIAEAQGNAPGMCAATTGKARLYGFDKQVIETQADAPMTRTEQEEADEWAEFRLWQASRARVIGIKAAAG